MSAKPSQKYALMVWKRLALAVVLIVVVALAYAAKQSVEQGKPSASSEAPSKTSLEGTWKLNRDQSDDAREKLRSAMQDRDQNTPMGRHGGMGGGGMGGGGIGMGIPGVGGMGRPGGPGGSGGMGRNPGSDEQRARLRDLVDAPEQLKVVQKGPEVDMTDPQYRERELFTDGRNTEKSKDAMQIPVKAHWDHEMLVSEEKGPNGEKISHRYELAADGQQLTDTLTLEGKGLHTPLIIRSVYDKAGLENTN